MFHKIITKKGVDKHGTISRTILKWANLNLTWLACFLSPLPSCPGLSRWFFLSPPPLTLALAKTHFDIPRMPEASSENELCPFKLLQAFCKLRPKEFGSLQRKAMASPLFECKETKSNLLARLIKWLVRNEMMNGGVSDTYPPTLSFSRGWFLAALDNFGIILRSLAPTWSGFQKFLSFDGNQFSTN